MGLERFRVKTPGIGALLARSLLCIIGLLFTFSPPVCEAFNLDVENPAVYSGPEGSYFGYAVDFYLADSSSASVLIGAPKANTRQVNVTEGGAVFYCPWSLSQTDCHTIEFDTEGDRPVTLNETQYQGDFKSHQWFGATVRSHNDTILACAPLYSWRTEKDARLTDPTGTCYLSIYNFTRFVEYAPCRTEISTEEGQGYCQGGFSADFTTDGKVVLGGPGSYYWQGQVISASKEDIIKAYYPGYFIQSVERQIQTKQIRSVHDDSYQGYSVAVGEFSGDQVEDFVAGVPKKQKMLYGSVYILNGTDLSTMIEYNGEQMGSYFGSAVATADINSDGMADLLVGAPMFMVRGSDGRLEEMGRVYVYLQRGPLDLELRQPHLTGTQVFGRFGSTIAPLGDLNQDGFNDVAISCPYGGEDQQGLVYIFNGYSDGLREKPSQVITGQWAAGTIPASFGFSLRGAKDLDMNGYPDLIVGAFGVNKAVLYRSRPIVNASGFLTVHPTMINPEEKNCMVTSGNTSIPVSCVNLSFCISADGKHLPGSLDFQVEVQLDSHKHKQKGAVKRALFLDSQQPLLQKSVTVRHGERVCDNTKIYLKEEKDFRDKLSSIYVALNFSLDPKAAADSHGLRPILNYQTTNVIEQKAQILLDCGEDNICVPDLKLAVHGNRKEVYLGDDNSLTLTFNARNEGEGGAYEAELYVVLPPEADYSGIARNNESLTQLTCSYETENQTRYLSCDLGNPMKSGTNLWAGLRFTVPRLKDQHKTVQFELQIRSKNENNSHSEVVPYKLEVVVQADVILQGVSRPDKVFFPPANWKVTKSYGVEQDVGPAVEHIYELVNNGPSRISHTLLELRCPLRVQGHNLLYPLEFSTEGPINCTSDKNMNHLHLKLQRTSTDPPILALKANEHHVERRDVHKNQLAHLTNLSCSNTECWMLQCNVGLLEKGTTAIVKVHSRVWAETFIERTYKQYVLECLARYSVKKMPYAILPKYSPSGQKKVVTPVVWNKPDIENSVPLWIIILAILAGLLLLALLIYVLYKFGFFKRSLPYGTAMEKAQLKPQAASEA
ncbi:Integrin alpha-5 Fibronectin receptor subunit alpha Integrin alpha-F [Larimichthys crocea]|uniref:Integrin alpha-5 Fibronectin receptor subunit alpha Integrin alpha-F n=1 Tax=Larimichthys crocea TaxID=215358 RepID=A0A6G0INK7_LARCR|nr:Integrin alpha-5 Fibronectin receptor subunit alpha Integrin alpha-F [Larimichthys crocea]